LISTHEASLLDKQNGLPTGHTARQTGPVLASLMKVWDPLNAHQPNLLAIIIIAPIYPKIDTCFYAIFI